MIDTREFRLVTNPQVMRRIVGVNEIEKDFGILNRRIRLMIAAIHIGQYRGILSNGGAQSAHHRHMIDAVHSAKLDVARKSINRILPNGGEFLALCVLLRVHLNDKESARLTHMVIKVVVRELDSFRWDRRDRALCSVIDSAFFSVAQGLIGLIHLARHQLAFLAAGWIAIGMVLERELAICLLDDWLCGRRINLEYLIKRHIILR
mmetsp:Transcript_23186/g.37131  ORF Transcript_23186/g.37131 Transcript_23186/m.37131 type:complete len:206 (+) Transcript_23186:591-1208(+)